MLSRLNLTMGQRAYPTTRQQEKQGEQITGNGDPGVQLRFGRVQWTRGVLKSKRPSYDPKSTLKPIER
jgi:hypothetical protein